MADTPLTPMTDADVTPSSDDALRPAAPLQTGGTEGGTLEGGKLAEARQALLDNTAKLRGDAGDKARGLAEDGKARAAGALDQLSQMLTDAAGQVDEKLGEQYGRYARSAADTVQGFSASINDKSVDDLIEDARVLVRKSPAVAIGAAAAIGFVVARLLTAGLDQRDRD